MIDVVQGESLSPDEKQIDDTPPSDDVIDNGTEQLLEKSIEVNEKYNNGKYYSKIENETDSVQQNGAVYLKTVEIFEKKSNGISSKLGSITSLKSIEKIQSVSCRTVLWYITFFGFIVNYMLRVNMNIAIVEMVTMPKRANQAAACFQSLNETFNSSLDTVNDVSILRIEND